MVRRHYKDNQEEFEKALMLRNNCYASGYFTVVDSFNKMKERLRVRTIYGDCYTAPWDLLQGVCPTIESAVNKNEFFINQAKEIHGDLYDYSKVEYVRLRDKIKIICSIHGEFTQLAGSHLIGKKCARCSQHSEKCTLRKENCKGHYTFKSAEKNKEKFLNKKATLYLVKLLGEDEVFYKVGVTTCRRYKERTSSLPKVYKKEIIAYFSVPLYHAIIIEQTLLENFNHLTYCPKIYFGGHKECLSVNPLEELQLLIKKIAKQKPMKDLTELELQNLIADLTHQMTDFSSRSFEYKELRKQLDDAKEEYHARRIRESSAKLHKALDNLSEHLDK